MIYPLNNIVNVGTLPNLNHTSTLKKRLSVMQILHNTIINCNETSEKYYQTLEE